MGSAWKFAAVFLGGILFAFSSRMVDPFLSSRPTVLVNKEEFGLVAPQPLTALTPAEMMAEMMAKENRKLRDQLESQQAELAVLRKGSVPRKVFHFLKEAGYGIGNMQSPQFFKDIDEQRGLLVVDVGACDGSDWAVPAATNRGHTVLAFEPIPANRDRFMQTVRGKGIEDRTVLVDPTSFLAIRWDWQNLSFRCMRVKFYWKGKDVFSERACLTHPSGLLFALGRNRECEGDK